MAAAAAAGAAAPGRVNESGTVSESQKKDCYGSHETAGSAARRVLCVPTTFTVS